MNKEFSHGNDGFFSRNDGDALGKLVSSAVGAQKDFSAYFGVSEETIEEVPHLDIHSSNRRLDQYLFYFSSRL